MNSITRIGSGLAALAVVAGGSVLAAPTASAAAGEQAFSCDGQQIVLRVSDNHSSEHGGWGAAQIVEGGTGTLIPTSFAGSAFDVTLDQELFGFSEVVAGGHAHGNQATITCTQVITGSLEDLLEPGDEVPPGVSLSDEVTFTLTVIAIRQP
jgi:hypothetical protein